MKCAEYIQEDDKVIAATYGESVFQNDERIKKEGFEENEIFVEVENNCPEAIREDLSLRVYDVQCKTFP